MALPHRVTSVLLLLVAILLIGVGVSTALRVPRATLYGARESTPSPLVSPTAVPLTTEPAVAAPPAQTTPVGTTSVPPVTSAVQGASTAQEPLRVPWIVDSLFTLVNVFD